MFALNRLMTADMLRRQPDEAFSRVGIHTERGAWTLGEILATYTGHLGHHLGFVRQKRALLGR